MERPEVKGSRRWMSIDPFPRFQPVELVKPLFIIFIANAIINPLTMMIHF